MNAKPVDRTKKSNRYCQHCAHFSEKVTNPVSNGRPGWNTGKPHLCPAAYNKPIAYWNCCKRFQWDPTAQYTEPLRDTIETRLKAIRQNADVLGVALDIDDSIFIDDNHLDCFWYGGYIGSLSFDGWKIIIEVNGEVRARVTTEDGDEFYYVNKNNTGAWGENICQFVAGDIQKNELVRSEKLIFGNNNWVEWLIQPPGMDVYDPMTQFDNVVDNNILDVFDNLEEYIEIIEQCKSPEMMKYFN